MAEPVKPHVDSFFDKQTFTISHVVSAPDERACAVIDPVLDFDASSGRTSTESADLLIEHLQKNDLVLEWILESHVHADHLSAAAYLKSKLGGQVGIGEHIGEVQRTFKEIYNVDRTFPTDGRQFDHLFADGECFQVGSMQARVIHTPGHTPACVTYLIGDAAFVGDTLFMPDFGTARCDFPGGNARQLYKSIQKILALPPETRLFMCHDYGPGGRAYAWETTVAEQRAANVHVREGIDEDAFVRMREERDATLGMPALIIPSVQVNMCAGDLPAPEENGVRYLKVPLNAL